MAAKKSKRAEFAEDVQASTGGEIKRILPSSIRANHQHNQRFAPYDTMPELVPYIGDKCCFRSEQIEKRLASFLEIGQIDPIEVSISNTGHPDLEVGFLRHCAFLLAEVRGVIDDIPGAKGIKVSGIRAEVVKAAKSQGDHEARARRNFAENAEHEQHSPVDIALYINRRLTAMRDDGTTMTVPELATEMKRSVDYVNKHRRLFTDLTPDELLAVHEGKLPMSRALKEASNRGSGKAKGPRGANPGIGRKAMRRRNRDDRPRRKLSPEQVDALLDVINGDAIAAECTDDVVQEWIRYYDAPPAPREPKTTRKKAAPKPGEQRKDA